MWKYALSVLILSLCSGVASADDKAQKELAEPDPKVAQRAARSLGESQRPQALSALLDALAAGVHPDVAEVAVSAVGSFHSAAAYDTLAAYANHRRPAVRQAALVALASHGDRRVVDLALARLHDFNPAVRATAQEILAARRVTRAVPALLVLLEKGDPGAALALSAVGDAEVARQVGERLGNVPDRLLAETLGGFLVRKDFGPKRARLQVVRALAKVPGPWALEQLKQYLRLVPKDAKTKAGREAKAFVKARTPKGDSK